MIRRQRASVSNETKRQMWQRDRETKYKTFRPITKQLKTMIINVNWQRNGVTVFKSNNFAGYIGIYNGLRPEDPTKPQGTTGWTLSCNDRFMKEGGYVGIYRWLTGMDPNGQFMSWLARSALTNNASKF